VSTTANASLFVVLGGALKSNDQRELDMLAYNNTTISYQISEFWRTGNFTHLVNATRLIVRQGRLLELLYGVYCFFRYPPSKLASANGELIDHCLTVAHESFVDLLNALNEALAKVADRSDVTPPLRNCLVHGFLFTDEMIVIGEYAPRSARICVFQGDRFDICEPYDADHGVRHIHLVHLHKDSVFVGTGDTHKYLDQYVVEDGRLRFNRRILRRFGGFTACCRIGDKLYLGTDFTSRPNYIYCLETGEIFPFPSRAYTQYCCMMLAIDNKYILSMNLSQPLIEKRRTLTLFDTESKSFIYAGDYGADELIPYPGH
jgi:hypothetical protein